MPLAAENEPERIGATCGCADHVLTHDLSKRPTLQGLWRDLKHKELDNI